MAAHVFTGFGFGPIQSGLFAKEAFQSGNFSRIVIAEVDAELVEKVRANKGCYYVNVAHTDGVEALKIDNVELLNPRVSADKRVLLKALSESTEIATCLPSVNFYESGGQESVASWVAESLKNRSSGTTIIYAAENNNHAAEILEKAVALKMGGAMPQRVQFLNTVIGKMSRVVTDPAEIAELQLKTIAPGIERAFLVEEFNKILVSRTHIANFEPGIRVFIEKDDLLPFEEAKLFGHNAIHSLLGFLGDLKGKAAMTQLKDDKAIMWIGTEAFLHESGAALVRKYARLGDELFAEAGFMQYAEDLLDRMTNPYLGDTIARVTRDIVRKLEIDGRIFGTMQLAIEQGIEPKNMALGAMAGVAMLLQKAQEYHLPADLCFEDWRRLDKTQIERILNWIWGGKTSKYSNQLIACVHKAQRPLSTLIQE